MSVLTALHAAASRWIALRRLTSYGLPLSKHKGSSPKGAFIRRQGLQVLDDPEINRLEHGGRVLQQEDHANHLQLFNLVVGCAIAHEEEDIPFLRRELVVQRANPIRKDVRCHPGLFVRCVIHRKSL